MPPDNLMKRGKHFVIYHSVRCFLCVSFLYSISNLRMSFRAFHMANTETGEAIQLTQISTDHTSVQATGTANNKSTSETLNIVQAYRLIFRSPRNELEYI